MKYHARLLDIEVYGEGGGVVFVCAWSRQEIVTFNTRNHIKEEDFREFGAVILTF